MRLDSLLPRGRVSGDDLPRIDGQGRDIVPEHLPENADGIGGDLAVAGDQRESFRNRLSKQNAIERSAITVLPRTHRLRREKADAYAVEALLPSRRMAFARRVRCNNVGDHFGPRIDASIEGEAKPL